MWQSTPHSNLHLKVTRPSLLSTLIMLLCYNLKLTPDPPLTSQLSQLKPNVDLHILPPCCHVCHLSPDRRAERCWLHMLTSPLFINMCTPFRLHMGEALTVSVRIVPCHITQLRGAHNETAASCCVSLQIIFMTLQDKHDDGKTDERHGSAWNKNKSQIWKHNAVFTHSDCLKLPLSPWRVVPTVCNNVTLQKWRSPWPLLLTLSRGECRAEAYMQRWMSWCPGTQRLSLWKKTAQHIKP